MKKSFYHIKKSMIKCLVSGILLFSISLISACSSVFSGGTGGTVVDAESTSTPKAGIANVEVYAYTSKDERDADFKKYEEGTVFTPSTDYFAHTTTGTDGSFTLSKLVWKTKPFKSDFGKDADYTTVYLLFYHENYGLTKGQTVIISDSVSDTVYQELTSIRKTTTLTINFNDVSDDSAATSSVYTKVLVPQTTATNAAAEPKIYSSTITGSGTIAVSYPRWQSDSDRAAGIETEPDILIAYVQSADEITWLGCFNGDSEDSDYSFRLNAEAYKDQISADEKATVISKKIKNSSYSVNLYGKATKFSYPDFSGYYGDPDKTESDGVHLILKGLDSEGSYTKNLGDTYTGFENRGNNGEQTHGVFSGLGGNSFFWTDYSYKDKWSSTSVRFETEDETELKTLKTMEIVSAHNSYSNLQL